MQAFSSNLVEILLGVKATFFHHFPSTSPCFPQARNQPPHVILFLDLGDFAHSNAVAVRRALHGHGATVLAVPGALPPPQEPLTAWLATKEVAEAMKEVMPEEQSVDQLFFGVARVAPVRITEGFERF
jgi:hypothetical protein